MSIFALLGVGQVAAVEDIDIPEVRLHPSGPHGPMFVVGNGDPFPATIYYANNQFDRDEEILKGMRLAYEKGFRVFSVQILLPDTASREAILATLDKFLDPFPDAMILPRVWMGSSRQWYEENPGELYELADGSRIPDIASPASDAWLQEANKRIVELIELIGSSKHASRFLGVIPLYYMTGEWHMWEIGRSGGYSPVMRDAFRQWALRRYASIQGVNAAWGTDYSSPEDIFLPTEKERNAGNLGHFRDPSRQQREIDFAGFFNSLSARQMLSIARTVKKATEGRSLVGYFYGYYFEHAWNNTWPQQSGHLALSRLLESPDIDFYGCSYSYNMFNRKFGLPVDFISPHDSAALHGKGVFFEEDSYTHLAIPPSEGLHAPGWQHRTRTPTETQAVLKRNFGVAVAHGEMMHWQDLLADGRFSEPAIWDWYDKAFAFRDSLELDAPYEPEVAVLVDETYPIWQRVEARAVFGRWVYETRIMLSRVDVTTGWYLQNDLERLPDSVRCVILLTPYHLTDSEKSALESRFMRDGRMVVLCYLPDLFRPGEKPRVSRFAKIKLELREEQINPESRLVPEGLDGITKAEVVGDSRDLSYIESLPDARLPDLSPYLVVNDPEAHVFARYTANDEPSCAWKEAGGWFSVYLGAPRLNVAAWRALFRMAGCHLYLADVSENFDEPDFLSASGNFVMLQAAGGGTRRLRLPSRAREINLWENGKSIPIAHDTDEVTLELDPGIPAYIQWK